jgi:uncharacterized Zn finger protein (UPF0148 family)
MTPGKKRRYKSLEVDRVDLVDRGANFDRGTGDGSHILLVKRDGATEKQDMTCPSCDASLSPGYGPNGTTLPNYCPECGAKITLRGTGGTAKRQESTMPAATQSEAADVNKIVADALAKQAAETDAKIAKAVEDARAAAKAEGEAEKAALAKRAEDAEKVAKAAEDLAKAEVERREVADAVAVAKSYAEAGVTAEDGPLLYRIGKVLPKEDVERVHTILRAAAEQARVGKLFAAAGRQGEQPVADANGNPEQVLFAKAAALRAAEPTLSEADAIDKACLLYPAERNAYQAYKRTQITGRPQ